MRRIGAISILSAIFPFIGILVPLEKVSSTIVRDFGGSVAPEQPSSTLAGTSSLRPAFYATNAATVQEVASQAESLVMQAKEQRMNYLQTKDERTKKFLKKNLDEAEKLVKGQLNRDPNCEKCMEVLISAYFFRTAFGLSKNYDKCIQT